MRSALFAVSLCAASLVPMSASAGPRRAQNVERQINARLDRRLHLTLQKLLEGPSAQSASADRGTKLSEAALLSRR